MTADLHQTGSWLDAQFERMAVDAGARAIDAAETISAEALERCNYFESFPGVAIAAGNSQTFYAPAACFHVYSRLEGVRLDAPYLATLVANCARNESDAGDPGRQTRFRMREAVFIGAADWVSRIREEWMERVTNFAESLALCGSLHPATDMFFGSPGRGRRLMQQLKTLKYELRMDAGTAGALAVSSFNLHETFFTSRFDITMADGSSAASGCAAFGLDRWALAYRARHHACIR